ncbi:hypothetical protein J2787_000773 [Chryseobacterium rhizosphaerae]|uniref:Nitrogen regulatory IIA protein n=1 Tax=Chryseobacterium rhizosphaerae TaxID=395937 RepID=A0AAE3Y4R8_9FLAO|nr:hypothetical protein [Chryseobacterium rhizosphaerae]MDR6525403.1 hypothetical protein [Chryseobacterium rhizosphaerae]
MKKLREKIERYILRVEDHWNAISVRKQQLMTKVLFGVYVLITVIVIVNICVTKDQRSNTISINHIEGISTKSVEKACEQKDLVESSIKK